MRRPLIACVVAACALAACSSSAAKSSGGTTGAPTTTIASGTTATPQPEQTIPATTRYVVDGKNVDLVCKGHGRIPVVFLVGGRETGAVWNGLVRALGDDVFACVYNRPGTTEEAVDEPVAELTTPSTIAKELAATLEQAGIGPRVVLVGHSAGGTDAIVFGADHPDLVAGAVLFDPSVAELLSSDEWKRSGYDGPATVAQARAVKSWPDVPLVILTADSKLVVANDEATPAEERTWIAGHQRWAALSPQGRQREVPGTGHFVYLSAPKVARDAVRDVLADAS